MGKFDWLKPNPSPRYFSIYVTVLDDSNNKIPSIIEIVDIEPPYFAEFGNTEFGAIPVGTRLVTVRVSAEGFKPYQNIFVVVPKIEIYVRLEPLVIKPTYPLLYTGRGSLLGPGYTRQVFPLMYNHRDEWEPYLDCLAKWGIKHHTTIIEGNTYGLLPENEQAEIDWTYRYGIPFLWTNNNWDINRLSEGFIENLTRWTKLSAQYGIINNFCLVSRYTGLDKAQPGSEYGPYLQNHQNELRLDNDNFWNLGPDTAYRTLAKGLIDINISLNLPTLVTLGNECKGKEFHRNAASYILSFDASADVMVNRQNDLPGHYDEHLMERDKFHRVEWHGQGYKSKGYDPAAVFNEESAPERKSYPAVIFGSKFGWNPNLANFSNDGGRNSDFAEDAYRYPEWIKLIRTLKLKNFTHQSLMKLPMRSNGLVNDLSMMDLEEPFIKEMVQLVKEN